MPQSLELNVAATLETLGVYYGAAPLAVDFSSDGAAATVSAKPFGTRTPVPFIERIISPRDALFPPTSGSRSSVTSSRGRTYFIARRFSGETRTLGDTEWNVGTLGLVRPAGPPPCRFLSSSERPPGPAIR